MKKPCFLALAVFAASAAFAQTPAARRDPMDPQARAPAAHYRSAFENYRPYRDSPVTGWREANEEVRAIGGHAGHLARPGAVAVPAGKPDAKDSPPAEKPKSSGHGGHQG
jgi:hypothetical protein